MKFTVMILCVQAGEGGGGVPGHGPGQCRGGKQGQLHPCCREQREKRPSEQPAEQQERQSEWRGEQQEWPSEQHGEQQERPSGGHEQQKPDCGQQNLPCSPHSSEDLKYIQYIIETWCRRRGYSRNILMFFSSKICTVR